MPYTRNALLFTLISLLIPTGLISQDNCSSRLERAEILFEKGIIEEIPGLLADCIRSGFTSEEKDRAHKLIILAYVFDNKIPQAENAMGRFLRENPEYQIQPRDPAEFVSLYSNFRTRPSFTLGAFLGGNLTSTTMLTNYGPYNSATDESYFSLLPETQLGLGVSAFLAGKLELNLDGIYSRNSFIHNVHYSFAEVYKRETHQILEFPVSLTYDLPGGRIIPYLRAGISYGLILNAQTNYRLKYLDGNSDIIESEMINISQGRSSGTFRALIGTGAKFKIPRGHIFFDMRYYYGLTELVIPESRWDQESTFRYYYTEGDFITDNLSFSIGYRYLFYRISKK
jgi:hypothetical protein